jgi:teichuronic acid biosynthesis glycosyltransferase TuaC
MRILSTTMCYPSDACPDRGIFVQRRLQALQNAAHQWTYPPDTSSQINVVSPQPWCPIIRRNRRQQSHNASIPATYPHMFSLPVLSWALDGYAFSHTLEKHIRNNDPHNIDLIDAHFVYPDGVGAWLAGKRLGIPTTVTVRGKIVSLSRKALRRKQIATMLRNVNARIAVSQSLADWVHNVAGSDLPVSVIPNGVNTQTFRTLDQTGARARLGWNYNQKYILSVGHLQRLKGFDRLIQAMPHLQKSCGPLKLVLVGSTRGEFRFKRKLQKQIARLNRRSESIGQEQCVTFTGPVSANTLNWMYNAADLMVNASRSEGHNNAIAEALAAGTPVVATDVGGNAEQICTDEIGRIVPNNDQQALQNAIAEALTSTWNPFYISSFGSARSWDTVATEVHRVFQQVLAKHRPKPKTPLAELAPVKTPSPIHAPMEVQS